VRKKGFKKFPSKGFLFRRTGSGSGSFLSKEGYQKQKKVFRNRRKKQKWGRGEGGDKKGKRKELWRK
jgi:hypothetical protein